MTHHDHERDPPARTERMTFFACGHEAGRTFAMTRFRGDLCPDCACGIRASAGSGSGPVLQTSAK